MICSNIPDLQVTFNNMSIPITHDVAVNDIMKKYCIIGDENNDNDDDDDDNDDNDIKNDDNDKKFKKKRNRKRSKN